MEKKQNPETPEDQTERFKREAQELVDAGNLNPTPADEASDGILTKQRRAS